jgi:hypothetical protein
MQNFIQKSTNTTLLWQKGGRLNLVSYIEIGISIALIWAGIEITIVSVLAKAVTKTWWWHRSTSQDWELKFGANSWSFNGAGTSPMNTIKKFWDDLNGKNASIKDIIKDEINSEIHKRTRYAVRKAIGHKVVARKVSKMITDEIQKQLNE